MLVVIEEAPGLDVAIWEAIESARAGGETRVIALGNPTVSSGIFYDIFTKHRALWKTFTIDAFGTPNLQGTTPLEFENLPAGMPEDDAFFAHRPTPYLITRRWVYEVAQRYGTHSAYWQARVRGEFPEQGEKMP